MSDEQQGVTVADGKYTVQCDGDGRIRCLRYGEPWRDLTGDGMVLALVQEIENLRADLARVTAERDAAYANHAAASRAIETLAHENDMVHRRNAEPVKHPDTEIVDWLEQKTVHLYCAGLYDAGPRAGVTVGCNWPLRRDYTGATLRDALRAAIDAARKQGGAE